MTNDRAIIDVNSSSVHDDRTDQGLLPGFDADTGPAWPISTRMADSQPAPIPHPAAAKPRTLLVGSAQSTAQLCTMLEALDVHVQPVGCLLPARSTEAANLPIPVLGDLETLDEVLEQHDVQQVFISLPLNMRNVAQRLTADLTRHGVTCRCLPTLADQLAGRVRLSISTECEDAAIAASMPGIDAIDPLALLGRKPNPLDETSIRQTVTGKVVLVTGAGGSIGSELARIVCRFEPAKLVLVERSENALFEIDRQLERIFPDVHRAATLHDVTDAHRTRAIVALQQPHVVFHAAAHKHVPMMEDHPAQAVENNFYGTRSIADAAAVAGVQRFVMISTDKAVNPTSVMGATKRLAELYVQYLADQQRTGDRSCIFSMVRFGNVLGSACSVLPIWTRQVAEGGPVTVTHPDMHRYFMTIPEAAGLVIQAASYATGGEVFLLDMGRPIRILDMAERFVRSHGLEPNVDIELRITGVRPGEKLFEELAYAGEDMIDTPHPSIRVWRSSPPAADVMCRHIQHFDGLRRRLDARGDHWERAGRDDVLNALRAAVPDMQHPVPPVTAAAG